MFDLNLTILYIILCITVFNSVATVSQVRWNSEIVLTTKGTYF